MRDYERAVLLDRVCHTHTVSKRLQVLLPEPEFSGIQRFARRERLTVGEGVRQALREARLRQPVNDPGTKLKAIRRAAEYSFPTADIDRMLGEIERGYQD